MFIVIVPIVLMLVIILGKKIPYIGGSVNIALVAAGLSALIMGGVYNPIAWLGAWVKGVDQIAWVLCLSIFGGVYAETQTELGALDTVLNSLRAKFGRSPKGLVLAIMMSLAIAGSLLGSAVATAAVIGVLVIRSLDDIGLKVELISAIIVLGASLGSIMPPISQATFLSSSLLNIDPQPVTQISYLTVGVGLVLCSWVVCRFYMPKDLKMPEALIPREKASQILKSRWKSLLPLCALVLIIVLKNLPKYSVDVISNILNLIRINDMPLIKWLSSITIVKGLSNNIVLSLITATLIAFMYPVVHRNVGRIIKNSLRTMKTGVGVQLCAGFMLGGFSVGGLIAIVQQFAQNLNDHVLKIGGTAALTLLGMLTGSQSTAQSTIFSFFGPALVAIGIDPVNAAVAGSHIAVAGQGLPPADITTFMVVGLVGTMLGTKVNPLKSMYYTSAMCFYFLIVGMIFLYI